MATKPAASKAKKVVIQYYHDGMPISPYQNKLSSIAYWYTKGCPGATVGANGHESMSSPDFKALLVKLGVKDPKAMAFEAKLPNGITISATLGKLVPIKPRVKKADRPEAVAARKVAKENAAESKEFKAEQARVRAWETNGKSGPRPKTPISDKLLGTVSAKRAPVAAKAKAKAPAKKAAARVTKRTPAAKATPAKAKATPAKATPAKTARASAARVTKRTPAKATTRRRGAA